MGLLNRKKNRPDLGWEFVGKRTWRAIDEEAGVVLYRTSVNDGGGLTAVPIEETDLQL